MIESNDYTENHGRRGFIALPAHMNGGRTGKELPRLDFELLEMNHNERGQRQSDCPGKRTRKDSAFDNHRIQIQQLCKSLLRSITDSERTSAFRQTQKLINHKIEALHDIEVSEGLVSSLLLHLGYILNKGCEEYIQDIGGIFSLLAMVYQCSDKIKAESFQQSGTEIFRMISSAFHSVRYTESFDWCTYHIMKVLRSLSRTKVASISMVSVGETLDMIRIVILDEESNLGTKLDAVATLKNITYYVDDKRLQILHHPGLIDALIKLCTVHGDEMGKEFASAVIRNLAMAPTTKVPMMEYSCLIDVLVELTEDPDLKTRRNAVSAIGSLAIADENSLAFVTHGEGIVLRILKELVEMEEDSIIRRRAARALRCFGRKETIEMIVDCRGIVDTLCNVAMHDASTEAKIEAIEALACYISHANEMAPYYNRMLDAMVSIGKSSPPPSCIEALIKTFNTLTCFERHRKPMTDHLGLLQTMSIIANTQKTSSICLEQVASAFHNLAQDEAAREKLASPHILPLLVTIGSTYDNVGNNTLARNYAILAIINVAIPESSRAQLAKESGLLNSLIRFASTSEDSDSKESAKATIIKLIPSL